MWFFKWSSAFLWHQISSKIRAIVRETFPCPQLWQRALEKGRGGGVTIRLTIFSVEDDGITLDLKPQHIVNQRALAIGQNRNR